MKTIIFTLISFLLLYLNSFSQNYNWDQVYKGNLSDTSYNSFKGISKADSLNIMSVVFSSEDPFPGYNRILKSTDAGMSWITVYKDFILKERPIEAYAISYTKKDFCIVSCERNYYLKTTDGGNNWKNYHVDIPIHSWGLHLISMLNDTHGIMATFKTLIVSHDGFETYDTIPLPIEGDIFGIYMMSPHSVYLLMNCNYGQHTHDIYFYKTSDEGKNWAEVSQIKYQWFYNSEMKFLDSLFGYIVGDRYAANGDPSQNIIFRTTNGGKFWDKLLDTIVPWNAWGLQSIDILDRKNAIALGQFGTIYWTHDGGDSWQLDSNANVREHIPATLYPCIIGTHTALIADFWARIFRSSLKPTDVEEEKRENNFNIINDNWISIYCNSYIYCALRIEYFDIQGNLVYTYKKLLQNTVNDLDISSLIEQKGIFVYRVYINDIIVKSGKIIK